MAEKHRLQIHHSNLFHPKPMGITHTALDTSNELLAVVRKPFYRDLKENLKIRNIDIYNIADKRSSRLLHSFVEYEQLTGIEWLAPDLLVTVSLEQTINIYSIKTGLQIFTTMTDYGPILSMKLSLEHNLLLTGTEYGYVAAYRIDEKFKSIEPIDKMVKINGPINFIDLNIKPRENQPAPKPKIIPNRPIKRKRVASSDGESEDDSDDDDDEMVKEFLSEQEILIFGASGRDVVVWNYHKKTITDTMHVDEGVTVNVLLALENGDVVVGDSVGSVSVFDTNTFTYRYTTNALTSGVLCMTRNSTGHTLYVSGQEPTLVIMKREATSKDEYRLFEKIDVHTHAVTSLSYLGKNKFVSGSLDGSLVRFKFDGRHQLQRHVIDPHFSDKVSFFEGEMMIQNNKSLVFWSLPKVDPSKTDSEPDHPEPIKVLQVKTKNFIQSSAFNSQRIAYSGPHGLFVFCRNGSDKPTMIHVDKSLAKCSGLKFCGDYLVACASNRLIVVEFDDKQEDIVEPSDCKIVAQHELKSIIQHLVYIESSRRLIVGCGPIKNLICMLDFDPDSAKPFEILEKVSLSTDRISFMLLNQCSKHVSSVYFYTDTNKIIKINTEKLDGAKVQKEFAGRASIQELPKDANIMGMIMVAEDQGILYDSGRIFKIDIRSNEIVNQSSDYKYIVRLDNLVFGSPQDVALVELKPEDYRAELPAMDSKKRMFSS